jgi:hypothetical protein
LFLSFIELKKKIKAQKNEARSALFVAPFWVPRRQHGSGEAGDAGLGWSGRARPEVVLRALLGLEGLHVEDRGEDELLEAHGHLLRLLAPKRRLLPTDMIRG